MTVPEIWQRQNRGGKKEKKENNEANCIISNSAKLDSRTKQHTQSGVSTSAVPEIWQRQNRGGKKEKKKIIIIIIMKRIGW